MRSNVSAVLLGVALVLATPVGASASHERSRCYDDGYCDGGGQRYDQNYGSGDDRNRSRNRNRGAFSPGPFDRSPVDAFNGNVVCLPGSTCYSDDRHRDDQRPPDQQRPESFSCLVPVPWHCDTKPEGGQRS